MNTRYCVKWLDSHVVERGMDLLHHLYRLSRTCRRRRMPTIFSILWSKFRELKIIAANRDWFVYLQFLHIGIVTSDVQYQIDGEIADPTELCFVCQCNSVQIAAPFTGHTLVFRPDGLVVFLEYGINNWLNICMLEHTSSDSQSE